MPTGYYTDSNGEKKPLPVSAHKHSLNKNHLADVGVSADGSVTDPANGQGLYWIGEGPLGSQSGKWFAGDAPTKAPVNETVITNWFEPTSWDPPNADNPDGAAGTWRPLGWPNPGFIWSSPDEFGIPSETVDGYIRLKPGIPDLFSGDGDFEDDSGGRWQLSPAGTSWENDGTAYNGTRYVRLSRESALYPGVRFKTAFQPNTTYTVSVRARTSSSAGPQTLYFRYNTTSVSSGQATTREVPNDGQWHEISVSMTTGAIAPEVEHETTLWLQHSGTEAAGHDIDLDDVRMTSDAVMVEWGREVNSGARPVPYGAAGTQSAGEYIYKMTALVRAIKDFNGSVGPWYLSLGFAFYKDNKPWTSDSAPEPSSTNIVWGSNRVNLATTSAGTDVWQPIEFYFNGRVSGGEVPSDAPVGSSKFWTDTRPDGPSDGFYFCPVIKVEGADADVLVDSVQVFRGTRQITAPGGVITTGVTATELVESPLLRTENLELIDPGKTVQRPLFSTALVRDVSSWQVIYEPGSEYAYPQPAPTLTGGYVTINWDDAAVDPPTRIERVNRWRYPKPTKPPGENDGPGYGYVNLEGHWTVAVDDQWFRSYGSSNTGIEWLQEFSGEDMTGDWTIGVEIANVSWGTATKIEFVVRDDDGREFVRTTITPGARRVIRFTIDEPYNNSGYWTFGMTDDVSTWLNPGAEAAEWDWRFVVLEKGYTDGSFFDPDDEGNEWLGTVGRSWSRIIPTQPGTKAAFVGLDERYVYWNTPCFVLVNSPAGSADYRVSLVSGSVVIGTTPTLTPDGTDQLSEFLTSTSGTARWVIEVDKPGSGWATVGSHTIKVLQSYTTYSVPPAIRNAVYPDAPEQLVNKKYVDDSLQPQARPASVVHPAHSGLYQQYYYPPLGAEDGSQWFDPSRLPTTPSLITTPALIETNTLSAEATDWTALPNAYQIHIKPTSPGFLDITGQCGARYNSFAVRYRVAVYVINKNGGSLAATSFTSAEVYCDTDSTNLVYQPVVVPASASVKMGMDYLIRMEMIGGTNGTGYTRMLLKAMFYPTPAQDTHYTVLRTS